MRERMSVFAAAVALALTGTALLLCVVSTLAWHRTRSGRFAFVAVAFLALSVRNGLIVLDGAGWVANPMAWDEWTLGVDALVVAALYLGIVKG